MELKAPSGYALHARHVICSLSLSPSWYHGIQARLPTSRGQIYTHNSWTCDCIPHPAPQFGAKLSATDMKMCISELQTPSMSTAALEIIGATCSDNTQAQNSLRCTTASMTCRAGVLGNSSQEVMIIATSTTAQAGLQDINAAPSTCQAPVSDTSTIKQVLQTLPQSTSLASLAHLVIYSMDGPPSIPPSTY